MQEKVTIFNALTELEGFFNRAGQRRGEGAVLLQKSILGGHTISSSM
jgi:hypothetical protein